MGLKHAARADKGSDGCARIDRVSRTRFVERLPKTREDGEGSSIPERYPRFSITPPTRPASRASAAVFAIGPAPAHDGLVRGTRSEPATQTAELMPHMNSRDQLDKGRLSASKPET